jgi:hypothetical protein
MEQQDRDRLSAGELWQEHGLVLASRAGAPLSANNVIRAFRTITPKAGLGEAWVPREMRHTIVSVLSANGVPVESIALLAQILVRALVRVACGNVRALLQDATDGLPGPVALTIKNQLAAHGRLSGSMVMDDLLAPQRWTLDHPDTASHLLEVRRSGCR